MIRQININDLDIIYLLGNKFDNKFSTVYKLNDYLNNNIYYLRCYEDNNIIKGFSISTIIDGLLELHMLFVDIIYRNEGIGSYLLNDIELKNVDRVLLEVSVNNIPAYNLYKKNGFKVINIRKKYYNGIDAYVMEKVIK